MYTAINICDLTGYIKPGEVFSSMQLLLKPILTKNVVNCEGKRFDGDSLLVDPDIEPKRWTAIYTIIREGCGNLEPIPKYKLRIYQSKTGKGSWKRI